MALLVLAGLACGAPRPGHAPATVAPWLRADPRRCLIQRDLREGMEMMAQHCAEEFVRQNGYTDVPATVDSSRWVMEHDEGGPWPLVFATRGNTLQRSASTVQCSQRQCIVLFRLRRPVLSCTYRAVSMTQVFTRIRLEPGGIHDLRCTERRT